jgi:integration host factor subunit alpha
VKKKAPRRGRNPATGGDLTLDGRRVITFKYSGVLKERINAVGNASAHNITVRLYH